MALASQGPHVSTALEGCYGVTEGLLESDGKPTDKWRADEYMSAHGCGGEATVEHAGDLYTRKVAISSAGVAKVLTHISLTLPGPCIHEYKRYTAHFAVPAAELVGSGEATGKLDKSESAPGCAPTRTSSVVFRALTTE